MLNPPFHLPSPHQPQLQSHASETSMWNLITSFCVVWKHRLQTSNGKKHSQIAFAFEVSNVILNHTWVCHECRMCYECYDVHTECDVISVVLVLRHICWDFFFTIAELVFSNIAELGYLLSVFTELSYSTFAELFVMWLYYYTRFWMLFLAEILFHGLVKDAIICFVNCMCKIQFYILNHRNWRVLENSYSNNQAIMQWVWECKWWLKMRR